MSDNRPGSSKFEQLSAWEVIDTLLEDEGTEDLGQPIRSRINDLFHSGLIPEKKRQSYNRRAFAAQYYLEPKNDWVRQAPTFEGKWPAVSWLIKKKEQVGERNTIETLMRSLEYGEHVPRDDPQYRWTAAAADRAGSDYIQQLVEETKNGIVFCREVKEKWDTVREEIKSTYHQQQPPENPWSQSYCYDIRRAAEIYLEVKKEVKEAGEPEEKEWNDFLD